MERASIPNVLWKEELELSPGDYVKFLGELDKDITDEQILAFSEVKNIHNFMPPFFVALCAKNSQEAFHRFGLYKQLICPLVVSIDEQSETLTIKLSFAIEGVDMPRFTLLNEQLVLLSLIRTGTGKDIVPVSVTSPYEYSHLLVDYLEVQPELADHNSLVFRTEDVQIPFITQNNVMWEYLEPELKRRLEELSKDHSFLNLVEKALFTAIPSDRFSRGEVAKSLGVSVRTMQRKLKEQGVTFAQLVQKVQKLLALRYMDTQELSTGEIAYLVGYKEPASFSRAFKNWTGQTITAYRGTL
ncbi:helix-turn-helix domain-containing protein [Bombilactobacillus bombi]|uniref:helix-turn-helix domain-containing protein n=1 Tax=Bombilactobacillus bombi TaxID=1303590 RepID=UPI0015E5C3EB|nr:AraC family transcriptional regulator [Bombilactobacillus bombi]